MNINLCIISRMSWSILNDDEAHVIQIDIPEFNELKDKIHSFYRLDEDSFHIYWQYSKETFLNINSYLTYTTALRLLAGRNIFYVALKDDFSSDDDIEAFLRKLDLVERLQEKERNKSKYDVKIPGVSDGGEEVEADEPASGEKRTDEKILAYALRKRPELEYYTADRTLRYNFIADIGKGMKGEIINCSAHKDIYFLETNTKSQSPDLANLFASPAGREMFKYKPRPKVKQKLNPALESPDLANLFASPAGREMFKYKPRPKVKQKLNPALEFVIQSSSRSSSIGDSSKSNCSAESNFSMPSTSSSNNLEERNRRTSIDLYEEAASILGLTCSETDDCKCLECQCHYFDFDEDVDLTSGSDYLMEHSSSCSIQ